MTLVDFLFNLSLWFSIDYGSILSSVTMCLLFFALIRAMVSRVTMLPIWLPQLPCMQFMFSQSFDWQGFSLLCYIFSWKRIWQYHFVNFHWKLTLWTISVSYLFSIFILAVCAFYWISHKLYMYCFPSLEALSWRRIHKTKRIKFNFFIKQLCVIVKAQPCVPSNSMTQFH